MRPTLYAELRHRALRELAPPELCRAVLRDAESNYVPFTVTERLVQAIWHDQRLHADTLVTNDGRQIRVLFPGWWNIESGPDFRCATLQFDDEPERKGDIEIHLRADDWHNHHHDDDSAYNDVILHVVLWEIGDPTPPSTRAGERIPQIILQRHLDAPLETLYDEINLDTYPHNVRPHGGGCVDVLRKLRPPQIESLLDAAGDERFESKARKFTRWIHRAGPQAAFFEAWMEALGYKNNKMPFRQLAQRLSTDDLAANRTNIAPLLFGLANFLPADAARDVHVKRLWSSWWKLRPDFAERVLPADGWRLSGTRPANHPHRRLGAAAALLKKHPNLLEKITGAIETDGDPAKLFLQVHDEYWNRHFTLGGRVQSKLVELIGTERAAQIVANVALPFITAMANANGDERLAAKARARYAVLSSGEANGLLRLAAQQFFADNTGTRRFLTTERRQQGMMQLFFDFCVNDKSGCRLCRFPELVASWPA